MKVGSSKRFGHLILRHAQQFEAGRLPVFLDQAIGHGEHLQGPETVQHLKPNEVRKHSKQKAQECPSQGLQVQTSMIINL